MHFYLSIENAHFVYVCSGLVFWYGHPKLSLKQLSNGPRIALKLW